MDRIDLSSEQVRELEGYLRRAEYPGGYAYVSKVIAQHPEFDPTTGYWFTKAQAINANLRTDSANVFIRSATACGLRWDRLAAGADVLQTTSNNIAKSVLGEIVQAKAITKVNAFLKEDIIRALASGQTLGGWGGSFYYWDAPYQVPGTDIVVSVGDYIRTRPDELEKFIACNAVASRDALLATEGWGLFSIIPWSTGILMPWRP